MADSTDTDTTIHPKPWPSDVGEALPGAKLPRQWIDDETSPPTPAPEPEPARRATKSPARGSKQRNDR